MGSQLDGLVELPAGARLRDRYRIVREIGRGERSIVYEALDTRHQRLVALKLLWPPNATGHLLRGRIEREMQRVRAIDHPGVVGAEEIFDLDGAIAIVAEHVRGSDLESQIKATGALPAELLVPIGCQLAEILAAAHARGIVHRDIKPSNILIDSEGLVRLTDFGCARLEGQTLLAEVDEPVATVAYLAPEVIAGRGVDPRTDLYSLGMTLYFALIGRVPPRGHPLPPAARAGGYHPRENRPDVPEWLDALAARATSAQPSDRFETADRLLDALRTRQVDERRECGADSLLPDVCVLCREAGTLGRSVCPHCEDEGPADTFVMLETPQDHTSAVDQRRVLAGLTHLKADSPELGRLIRGQRPLLRVSRGYGRRVAQRLAGHGLRAKLLSARNRWTVVSPRFRRAPLLAPGPAVRPPQPLVQKVVEVIPQLELGEARGLLVETLRLGADLFGRLRRDSDREAAQALAGALGAASDAARELVSIDSVLEALVLHGEQRYALPAGLAESRSMYENARASAIHALLEATAELSQLRSRDLHDAALIEERARNVEAVLSEAAELAAELAKEGLSLLAAPRSP